MMIYLISSPRDGDEQIKNNKKVLDNTMTGCYDNKVA